MIKRQILLYILFAAIFIVTTFYKPYLLSGFVKIIPMGILIIVTVKMMTSVRHRLFSAGGDFFLDYDQVNWFIFGLGSFLIAHLFYMMSLRPVESKNIATVLAYCCYGLIMFCLISPGLDELFIPVLVYMSVLMFMGIFTLISKKSNGWLITGGISFIISDSVIGIDKFYTTIPYSHIIIMTTYYFAQFSLVKGMFENTISKAEI